jgi:ThiJ/PfpI family-like
LARILIPTPSVDFDPSEVAVSWQVLTQGGHNVVFATPSGQMARGDEVMPTGEGLDPWGLVSGLRRAVVIGRFLRADQDARDAYAQMEDAAEFRAPIRWDEINLAAVDGVLLYGRKTTCLTWSLERRAWHVARIARFWDPDYYRTYKEQPGQPAGYMSVQAEVTRALAANDDFQDVSPDDPEAGRKTSGRYRDTLVDERPAFVVQDGSYLSARWPGDVRTFAKRFAAILRSEEEKPRIASPSGRRRD